MLITLDIETHDRRIGFEIAGAEASLKSDTAIPVPGGATLKFKGMVVRRSVGIPEVLQFVIETSAALEVGLLGSWLYDKVKGRQVEKIVINRRVIAEITQDGIRQVLEEEIRNFE